MSTKKALIGFLFFLVVNLTIIFSANAVYASDLTDSSSTNITAEESKPEITQEEQKILDFKSEILRLINIERANYGVNELETLEILNQAGDLRAEEASISFSHTRVDGSSNFTVFSDFSLPYKVAGENLGYGYPTADKLVDAWMNSELHRKNILYSNFKYLGIGYYSNKDGIIYCSQIFYTPKDTL